MWNASPRKTRIAQLGGDFPFTKIRNQLQKLTRKKSSLILQIRCAHFPLNAYLHKIGKSNTDKCPNCNEQQENPPRETINHLIFECPPYEEARNALIAKIEINNFHLPEIMTNADRMKALTTFINRTKRLKNNN